MFLSVSLYLERCIYGLRYEVQGRGREEEGKRKSSRNEGSVYHIKEGRKEEGVTVTEYFHQVTVTVTVAEAL